MTNKKILILCKVKFCFRLCLKTQKNLYRNRFNSCFWFFVLLKISVNFVCLWWCNDWQYTYTCSTLHTYVHTLTGRSKYRTVEIGRRKFSVEIKSRKTVNYMSQNNKKKKKITNRFIPSTYNETPRKFV